MPEILAEFHFLRPFWLLALPPLVVLLWALWRPRIADSAWLQVCDSKLLPYLLVSRAGRDSRWFVAVLGLGWLLTVLALAGPTWSKRSQPVFQSLAARVIVLDLSQSMLAPDLKPSRLVRARFKVADILARSNEGQSGLVVFAGDAFAVTPVTQDANTIATLLPVLEPALMPAQGSRADLGLFKAQELLKQAGLRRGEVLLVTDGADERALTAAAQLNAAGTRVSVLAVGTGDGAPIPVQGGFLKDRAGNIVIPRLDTELLRSLAGAGGGRYVDITAGDGDLQRLLGDPGAEFAVDNERSDRQTESWREQGPWLVLLLLPLAALAFRRGWLVVLVLWVVPPQASRAFDWQDLWQRPDQQAARLLEQGDPARAAELATDPLQRGTANFRAERFDQAAADFARIPSADGQYNRANALAKLGRYQEALAAYDAALAADPTMADARYNRDIVEQLLNQQPPQQTDGGQQQEQPPQQSDEQQDKRSGAGGEQSEASREDEQSPQSTQPGQDEQSEPRQAQDNPGEAQQDEAQESQPEQSAQAEQTEQPGEQTQEQTQPEGEPPVEPQDAEQQQALDQWLRRIPDDPGGLLRNKFLYQYQRSQRQRDTGAEVVW